MAIETTRIPNLPAVYARQVGHISIKEVEQMFADSAQLLEDVPPPYYRITDVRESKTDFHEFSRILLATSREGRYRTSDPDLTVVFVGSNKWAQNLRNIVATRGIWIWCFSTLEEALAYIESDLEQRSSATR